MKWNGGMSECKHTLADTQVTAVSRETAWCLCSKTDWTLIVRQTERHKRRQTQEGESEEVNMEQDCRQCSSHPPSLSHHSPLYPVPICAISWLWNLLHMTFHNLCFKHHSYTKSTSTLKEGTYNLTGGGFIQISTYLSDKKVKQHKLHWRKAAYHL